MGHFGRRSGLSCKLIGAFARARQKKNCFQKNLFLLTFISFMRLMCLELCGTSCFKGNEDLVTRHTCHQASV